MTLTPAQLDLRDATNEAAIRAEARVVEAARAFVHGRRGARVTLERAVRVLELAERTHREAERA